MIQEDVHFFFIAEKLSGCINPYSTNFGMIYIGTPIFPSNDRRNPEKLAY